MTGAHAALRPRLRWSLPVGVDGARVTLCRDRALTVGCVTQLATGTTVSLAADLTVGVWFWGLRGVRAGATGAATSAVWRLVVGNRPGSGRAWGGDFDFNGDGYADLHFAVPGRSAGVRLSGPAGFNGPAIHFDPPIEATGFGNGSAHGGDVDGDGYSDFVVGAPGSATAYVYRGGPTSAIGATPTWTLRGPAGSNLGQQLVASADLDGDGFVDVAAAGPTLGLLWFPGSATGPRAGARLSVSITSCTAVGDTNDDDRDDLLCTDQVSTTTTARGLYPGAAAGLGAGVVLPGRSEPAYDVNGDGLADVWLDANALRLGARASTAPTMVPIPTREGVTVLRPAGDLDGDGYSDLFSGGDFAYGSVEVTFARGTAAGLGATEIQYAGCDTRRLGYPIFADTSGDGRDEVIVNATERFYTDPQNNLFVDLLLPATAALIERGPTGFEGYASALTLPVESGRVVASITPLGDVNNDGYGDFVFAHTRYTGLNDSVPDPVTTVVYGGASALRTAPVSPRVPDGPRFAPGVVAVGDLNGDRGADLVLYTDTAAFVYLTAGGALPATGAPIATGFTQLTSVVALGDVNGDGRTDIAVNSVSQAVVLLGSPTGFAAPTMLAAAAPTLAYDALGQGGDLDRDGLADVVALGRTSTGVDFSVHLGARSGLSSAAAWRLPGLRGTPRSMGDLNGDGYNDLFLGGTSVMAPTLLFGGAAGPTRVTAFAPRTYVPSPWDWNRDGRADALVWSRGVGLEVHYGTTTDGISAASSGLCQFVPARDDWNVAPVGDVNGDGTPDLAGSQQFLTSDARLRALRLEMVRVILIGRRSTGPLPMPIAGFDNTQILR